MHGKYSGLVFVIRELSICVISQSCLLRKYSLVWNFRVLIQTLSHGELASGSECQVWYIGRKICWLVFWNLKYSVVQFFSFLFASHLYCSHPVLIEKLGLRKNRNVLFHKFHAFFQFYFSRRLSVGFQPSSA